MLKASGLVDMILAVTDLEGQPLSIDPKDLYYVPQHSKDDI